MKRSFCVLAALLHDQKVAMPNTKLITDFKEWKFHYPPNYTKLPIDRNPEYNQPVAVKNAVFSEVPAEPIGGKLRLICASDDVLTDILDLDPKVAETEEFIQFVAGAYLPEGGVSVSHRYGGYQFGIWADQLGDGRAHILGEYINSKGESWQPQLKGSGETPYSRFGDGRAVLRSSIREMIASEACYHLGIPTTRAAALVASDDCTVWRDKRYNGHARKERAAIVMRLAPAWYRLGSLEILNKRKEHDLMRTLADFIIKHHFPNIDLSDPDKYVKWYSQIAYSNLDMVTTWQAMGFTHGVLNTDNISLLGLTIDYGPYGFIDHYYEYHVSNASDEEGRYGFYRQPDSILWNLDKFAEALAPLLKEDQLKAIQDMILILDQYVKSKILKAYLQKLGLQEVKDGDLGFVRGLFHIMQDSSADFTATFYQLSKVTVDQMLDEAELEPYWSLRKMRKMRRWREWVSGYRDRLQQENVTDDTRRERMRRVNPVYVPRNWILQDAIVDAENNDFDKVRLLLKVFKKPFEVNEEAEKLGYSAKPPNWSYGLKLNCSS